MVKRKRAGLVKLTNLPMLQNLIRRDPPSYREEFTLQYRHYESQRDIFMSQPEGTSGETFADLVGFMSQVTSCYPDLTENFPSDLAGLLLKHHNVLHHELREKLVQSLVLLRNKDVIPSTTLLQTLFPILTTTTSKALRTQIYSTVTSDLRTSNSKIKNHKLNKTVQTVLFGLVEAGKGDAASTAGLWAVKLTRELWKRRVWDDARTVEIMKEASLCTNPKVISGGIRFFLGVDREMEEQEDSDDEAVDIGRAKHQVGINKKTNKKKRQLEKAYALLKKKEKNKNKPHPLNFSALHLLHDPQGFAEALFSKHLSRNNKLMMEQKLLVLQLISRLVGLHKLSVLGLYSYLLKFLTPRQRDVTQFLVCCAQASHDLVPPDVLEPIVKKIADEFVSEGVAAEVATAGLNGIREICARAPLAMNATLLQDLTDYKGSKDKGVMMAARGLIGLYREVAPEMLKKKDRGKVATMDMKNREALRFGIEKEGVIEGLELLEQWKAEQKQLKKAARGEIEAEEANEGEGGENEEEWEDEEDGDDEDSDDDDANWAGWEVEEDDNEEEETGWINVASDDEIEISDSEDENENGKPKKKTKVDEEEEEEEEKEGLLKEVEIEEKKISTLATTKILTPADFAKLAELKTEAGLEKLMGKRITNEDAVDTDAIKGPQKRGKSDKEARLAAVMEGREGREKFGSKKGKRDKTHSTTNKEKARGKNFMMTKSKAKGKQKRSLVEKQRILKAHVEKQKKSKRKG
ncbi:SDA1-domain-containing protein [Choiromyces venosus 120613-1]|uniref:Protein SDA1 n=1 Tax=Choiromyces venosus 120613-1 TaxID=1336337 RepID=A0A3N4K8C3_9PEZI|nr:SDA1-domain-containing protein [Choiromyces venosus 120613-1]